MFIAFLCTLFVQSFGHINEDIFKHGHHTIISYTDSPVEYIHWCGERDDQFLALTEKGNVYKVENNQWENLEEIFEKKALLLTLDLNQIGVVARMYINPIDPAVVLFQGTKHVFWITTDCGNSFRAVRTAEQLSNFEFHQTERDYIISTALTICSELDCLQYISLVYSNDLGVTWQTLQSYINQVAWAPYSKEYPFRLFATLDPTGHGNQSFSGWNGNYSFYYSDDLFQNKTKVLEKCSRFKVGEQYLFFGQATDTAEIHLYFSDLYDLRLNRVHPNEQFKESEYQILDTQYDKIFVGVNHFNTKIMSNVFFNDELSQRFEKSLDYLARVDTIYDFHRLPGIHDIFVANVFPKEQANLFIDALTYYQEKGLFKGEHQTYTEQDLSKFKQTMITFDGGKTWSQIKNDECKDQVNCSLHLNINTNFGVSPLYSTKSVPGLIIANGKTGQYLTGNKTEFDTYLSNDAGQTWKKIAMGPHTYEFFKHGDVLIIGSDLGLTDKLLFSLDQGMNWTEIQLEVPIIYFNFKQVPLYIKNIINRSMYFISYGETQDGKGLNIQIEFQSETFRKCLDANDLQKEVSDFQLLSLPLNQEKHCHNGEQQKYIVRKQNSTCLVGQQLNQSKIITYCLCQETDFECVNGYDSVTRKCLEVDDIPIDQQCQAQEFYIKKATQRKRRGNTCLSEEVFNDEYLNCPSIRWFTLLLLPFLLIVFILIRRRYLKERQVEIVRRNAQESRELFEERQEDSLFV